MTSRHAAVLLALLLVVASAPSALAADSVSISLAVDGSAVEAGSSTVVEQDPDLGIEVAGDVIIDAIIVRVDGGTVATYEPDETDFSTTYAADLADGENELTVIVETDAGVDSWTATVIKDDRAPFVRFTGPFETAHHRDVIPESASVNGSQVTIAGELHDESTVERVSIHRSFRYYHANVQHVSEARWDVEDPGDSFAREVFLGNGTNVVTVRVTDTMGHARDYNIELEVNDTRAPEVDLQLPDTTGRSNLPLGGEVWDNGQLDTVTASVDGVVESKVLYYGINDEPDPTAARMAIPGTVPLRPGENTVTVTATDLAGNTVEVSRTVVYERTVVPVVTVDRDATRFTADGSVRVVGTVSDGEITGVTIESVAADSGDIVDLVRVYADGTVERSVAVDETLAVAEGETRVEIRSTDSNGDEHQSSFTARPDTETFVWSSEAEPEPSGTEAEDQPAAAATDASAEEPGDGGASSTEPSEGPGDEGSASSAESPEEDEELLGITSVADGLPGFTSVTAAGALVLFVVLAGWRRRGS